MTREITQLEHQEIELNSAGEQAREGQDQGQGGFCLGLVSRAQEKKSWRHVYWCTEYDCDMKMKDRDRTVNRRTYRPCVLVTGHYSRLPTLICF